MRDSEAHARRRAAAYRRAADAHRRGRDTEAAAARFFEAVGDVGAAARHRANAEQQHELAGDDDARACAASEDLEF
jgi:hypothetical protein